MEHFHWRTVWNPPTSMLPPAKTPTTSFCGPVAWLFGAEGQGLSPALLARADRCVIIPMAAGIESLNVAAAAAVCLFEQARQRRTATKS